jgi:hypothetical protein
MDDETVINSHRTCSGQQAVTAVTSVLVRAELPKPGTFALWIFAMITAFSLDLREPQE